jgi:signal transduction histidine kinase
VTQLAERLGDLPQMGLSAPRGRMAARLLGLRHSIGARMSAAFIAMGIITGVIGGYGIYVLGAARGIVVETYDGPLMAINFARAASLDFAEMDKESLRRKAAPPASRSEIDARIDALHATFLDDIGVAEQRSLGAREDATIKRIIGAVERWNALRRAASPAEGDIEATTTEIIDAFDTLTELTADRSFVQRRKAVAAIDSFRRASLILSGAALVLGVLITTVLARQMIGPLTAAARVADRIADGHLETPIPAGGQDETGTLLRSMTVMQNNIREMMQREVEQRQSAQSRLFDALESAQQGIILVDDHGKIVIANSQVADFFPTVAPHLASGGDFARAFASMRALLSWREGSVDKKPDIFFESATSAPGSAVREYQIKDGRWIRFSHSDTRDGGFFLSLIDFTEIKQREEHFKEAKRQADAANTAKGHFLTNMSHELRTPLNAIIGFSEMIDGEMFGSIGNPQYLEYTGYVLQSARHLLEIINSVLDIAKSEAGKLELRAEDCDLARIVHECATMMRDMSARAELNLEIALPDGPLPVYGEAAKLRQIILNLLSNAVKFNRPGGRVSLVVDPGDERMTVFRIVDDGIGMSAAEIELAMQPFGQVDSTLARRYEGTGLGLPLTKALVELHGGVLRIASEPGRGTTVTVAIPRSADISAMEHTA